MKNTMKILFFLLFTLNCLSQNTTDWKDVSSPEGDFTISLPSDFVFYKEDEKYSLYGFLDDVTMTVNIQKNSRAKESIAQMKNTPPKTKSQITNFSKDDFDGSIYIWNLEKYDSVSIFMASSKYFYSISVSSKQSPNTTFEKFLHSILLNGQSLFKPTNPSLQKSESAVNVRSLENSAEVLAALKMKDAEKTKIEYDLERKVKADPNKEIIKYSRPVIMLRKPTPSYTDNARQSDISGTVLLRVAFGADAKVRIISVVRELKKGLTNEAIKAARKIKFLPAQVDGKPVDIILMVQYTFTVY